MNVVEALSRGAMSYDTGGKLEGYFLVQPITITVEELYDTL